MPKLVLLWSDGVVLGLLLVTLACVVQALRHRAHRMLWRRVLRHAPALCALVVLAAFVAVAALDSVHFRLALSAVRTAQGAATAPVVYATQTTSVLDTLLARPSDGRETSYSAPLAMRAFGRTASAAVDPAGAAGAEVDPPRLRYGGARLHTDAERPADLARRIGLGLAAGLALAAVAGMVLTGAHARATRLPLGAAFVRIARNRCDLPWRAAWATAALVCLVAGVTAALAAGYHVFGTDRTGNDVLCQALKSVRTAIVIGTLSTVATLPMAVALGLAAGALRGWVDDAVLYLAAVLSSIPNVLLIAACVLMLQVFIDGRPDLFETGVERADARLVLLCVILGLTNWADLCRLLRAETMKLVALDPVLAAVALGVGRWRVLSRHVLPHVVHLIVITTVLDFSSLVLYEAVLSYVGVGVDPSMNSFGGMINLARTELAHDPLVWWSCSAAFLCMVTLVLAAHLFADGLRAVFDPAALVGRAPRPASVPAHR